MYIYKKEKHVLIKWYKEEIKNLISQSKPIDNELKRLQKLIDNLNKEYAVDTPFKRNVGNYKNKI